MPSNFIDVSTHSSRKKSRIYNFLNVPFTWEEKKENQLNSSLLPILYLLCILIIYSETNEFTLKNCQMGIQHLTMLYRDM